MYWRVGGILDESRGREEDQGLVVEIFNWDWMTKMERMDDGG